MVLTEMHKRSLQLGPQRKDVYVNKLLEFQKKGGSPDERFLDQLLTMALIEARSCERFKRLSEALADEYLRKFYRKFMESELYLIYQSCRHLFTKRTGKKKMERMDIL